MTALARGTQRKLARTACGYRPWRAFWGDRVVCRNKCRKGAIDEVLRIAHLIIYIVTHSNRR